MITVVIDHISWHEAQQEHTDNHNLNGGGCHYQSGFRLVMPPDVFIVVHKHKDEEFAGTPLSSMGSKHFYKLLLPA